MKSQKLVRENIKERKKKPINVEILELLTNMNMWANWTQCCGPAEGLWKPRLL